MQNIKGALNKLGIGFDELTKWRILRKSLDGRSRSNLKFVYSVAVDVADEENRLEDVERLQAAGLSILDLSPRTVADTARHLRRLGAALECCGAGIMDSGRNRDHVAASGSFRMRHILANFALFGTMLEK